MLILAPVVGVMRPLCDVVASANAFLTDRHPYSSSPRVHNSNLAQLPLLATERTRLLTGSHVCPLAHGTQASRSRIFCSLASHRSRRCWDCPALTMEYCSRKSHLVAGKQTDRPRHTPWNRCHDPLATDSSPTCARNLPVSSWGRPVGDYSSRGVTATRCGSAAPATNARQGQNERSYAQCYLRTHHCDLRLRPATQPVLRP